MVQSTQTTDYITVRKDLTIMNDLKVDGDIDFGDAATNTLQVNGLATFEENINIKKPATISTATVTNAGINTATATSLNVSGTSTLATAGVSGVLTVSRDNTNDAGSLVISNAGTEGTPTALKRLRLSQQTRDRYSRMEWQRMWQQARLRL